MATLSSLGSMDASFGTLRRQRADAMRGVSTRSFRRWLAMLTIRWKAMHS